MPVIRKPCPLCGAPARRVASRPSPLTGAVFDLDRCSQCSFVFVRNPRTDFTKLYDAAYYAGSGADRAVDYVNEMEDPGTVRVYEWRGIARAVEALVPVSVATRWLDYGCGLGGLVRWLREERGCESFGFEEGYAAERLASARIPHVMAHDLDAQAGTFDVVTAIEVLEHAVDPIATLSQIRDLLRPGGVLFLTTGNAQPFRDRLTRWSYTAVPDVHVSFFQPSTLADALVRAGLEPVHPGRLPGLDDVIRYKTLKALRLRRRNGFERAVPWSLAARIVDRRYRVSEMPLARRP
jgi:SAM-dependent methyltransferase